VAPREHVEKVKSNVGLRITELREARGWTQQQCAEELDMPLKNLQRIESGANLTIATLVRLANGLKVSVRVLFDEPSTKRRGPGRPRSSGRG
jgi:transcriptional regulator with XRE-family HTH domain